jgi:hypothetical protein
VGTASVSALSRSLEPYCHFFVRTGGRPRGVPRRTVRIIGESLGEGGVRSPSLVGGCGLLDSGAH